MSFNWYALDEGFKKWMLVHLIPTDSNVYNEICRNTNTFKDVELEISISGVPVETDQFIDGVHKNMKYYAEHYANEKVANELASFNDKLNSLQDLMKERAQKIITDAGMEILEGYW